MQADLTARERILPAVEYTRHGLIAESNHLAGRYGCKQLKEQVVHPGGIHKTSHIS
jgi:hypothetical protein